MKTNKQQQKTNKEPLHCLFTKVMASTIKDMEQKQQPNKLLLPKQNKTKNTPPPKKKKSQQN